MLTRANLNQHMYFSACSPYTTNEEHADGGAPGTSRVESYGRFVTPDLVDATVKVLLERDDARRRGLAPPPPVRVAASTCNGRGRAAECTRANGHVRRGPCPGLGQQVRATGHARQAHATHQG